MNIKLPEAEVVKLCAAAEVVISAIETLPSGGTHLVCRTIEGADEMRHRCKKHLIEGRVKRFPFLVANKY
ncbi:MAG: hypothetical protein WBL74_10885 [Novosphingobium sp.]|uniref:hypothetical protein n=1 Tax=Novosphingobium sp. TaxID=1874826 RepID=UPI003C7E88C9